MPKTFETYNAELQNNVLTIQKGNITEKKRIELTRLQGGIAIASFTAGVIIAAVSRSLLD